MHSASCNNNKTHSLRANFEAIRQTTAVRPQHPQTPNETNTALPIHKNYTAHSARNAENVSCNHHPSPVHLPCSTIILNTSRETAQHTLLTQGPHPPARSNTNNKRVGGLLSPCPQPRAPHTRTSKVHGESLSQLRWINATLIHSGPRRNIHRSEARAGTGQVQTRALFPLRERQCW